MFERSCLLALHNLMRELVDISTHVAKMRSTQTGYLPHVNQVEAEMSTKSVQYN